MKNLFRLLVLVSFTLVFFACTPRHHSCPYMKEMHNKGGCGHECAAKCDNHNKDHDKKCPCCADKCAGGEKKDKFDGKDHSGHGCMGGPGKCAK